MVYALPMTLQHRNNCCKASIAFSALTLILIGIAAFKIIPAYPEAAAGAALRSSGPIQSMAAAFLNPAPYVPFISTLGSVIYALVSTALIFHYFEKTQSPEILFVSLFVFSLAFECIRVMVPLKTAMELSNEYLVMTARVLVFGRYFGLFSLFAAGVCAAGLRVEKQQDIVFIITAIALVIALGVPIDSLAWDSALNMVLGYASMFLVMEAGIILITMVNFFVSAYTRGTKEFLFAGLGTLLAYTGRHILLNADTWVTPLPGLLILSAGTWFICTRLHRVYLWL
jgi:hypothetical protein